LQKGVVREDHPTLVRVHVENSWNDLLFSQAQQPGLHYEKALEMMSKSESAVFVYLRKEGLQSSIASWTGKHQDLHERKMDPREYGIGAQILRQLGVRKIQLLGNPQSAKVVGLRGFGLEIEQVGFM
ncbi:bifunctional 3,4-dihydroxy-2-butanone-4-phosphate synthase/GTP cyclohydrolase II, partial [bacterium]|nr:bifunctional 3,4-dihydroxy-2-butanone-4-phosphate synthase/GTP cyclohydrolase II [bacterium]